MDKAYNIAPFLWMRGEDHKVIREELDRIRECGIRAVCVESRPHPDFLGEGWWADMDFIMEEAGKNDMQVWLLDDAHFPTGYANGMIPSAHPGLKKKYINYNVIDVWGYLEEVTLDIYEVVRPLRGWSQRVSKEIREQEKQNEVLAVCAYRLTEDDRIDESECLELTGLIENGTITFRFPDGAWRVFVLYKAEANAANGGNPDYINIIDRDSVRVLIDAVYEPHYAHYKEQFGKTFMGFFSDEPGFGNTSGFAKDERIGHKDMGLPWCQELEEMLDRDYPGVWEKLLPYLWMPTAQMRKAVSFRRYYMDAVTGLYAENFSKQLGQWCEERGVRYIGHVIEDSGQHSRLGCGAGHYFRAMSGQHMAGIDTIGTQLMMGGAHYRRSNTSRTDGKFFHYVLAKLAASSAALDGNKHGMAMCELFGAYGWELRLRDMKWITDHLLVNGVNFFVPHAFSMAEYPDFDCPPHFYARGNNPQFPCFAELMKYAGAMGGLLTGGRPVVHAAVLYHAESEWMGDYMPMDDVACALTLAGINFLFACTDHIRKAVRSGKGFEINGVRFEKLIIPYCEYIPGEIMEQAETIGMENIIFVKAYPTAAVCGKEIRLWDQTAYAGACCCELADLAERVFDGIQRDVILEKEFPDMRYYHYVRDGRHILFFHNESVSEDYEGEICLPGKGNISVRIPVYGTMLLMEDADGAYSRWEITGEELRRSECTEEKNGDQTEAETVEMDISRDWRISCCRASDYPDLTACGEMDELIPFSRLEPQFSGVIAYEKTVVLEEVQPGKQSSIIFSAEDICDGAQIFVNGVQAGTMFAPPYRIGIGGLVKSGENMIRVEVRTTLEREQKKLSALSFAKMLLPQNPTGMFGQIKLCFRQEADVKTEKDRG